MVQRAHRRCDNIAVVCSLMALFRRILPIQHTTAQEAAVAIQNQGEYTHVVKVRRDVVVKCLPTAQNDPSGILELLRCSHDGRLPGLSNVVVKVEDTSDVRTKTTHE
jgi:hypothetical protein